VLNGDTLNLATQGAMNEMFCRGEIDTVTHGGEQESGVAGCGEWGLDLVFLAGLIVGPATSQGSHIHRTRVIRNMQHAMEPSKDALSTHRWDGKWTRKAP
jgi:hypothetical protein